MTETKTFNFRALVDGLETVHTVRCVTIDGKPWFAAVDVFRALGSYIRRTGKVEAATGVALLSEEDRVTRRISTPGGYQECITVSEAGLNLILMRSDKPAARPFQDWLAREVLPSIRKTGSYSLGAGETIPLPTSFAQALRQHAETLVKLAEEQEAHAVTEAARIAAQEAKAQAAAELERVMPAASIGAMAQKHNWTLQRFVRTFPSRSDRELAERVALIPKPPSIVTTTSNTIGLRTSPSRPEKLRNLP